MRQMMMALALLGALSTAAYAQAPPKTKAKTTATKAASHSVSGTIKAVDANTLTVTRSGKDKGDLQVMLNSSTKKDGNMAVGSKVSVRYNEENGQNIATAVKASAAPAAKPASSGKKK
jgi:hypothetical protein